MANEVYANGMEIACKAAAGKSVAATPDTCLSPPSPPAGPVPIPYPNTSYASDTTKGTTTVMISGQEVMMKDQSTFKKSTGDEAATRSLGMGVVTHCIQGEASFCAWSMDVIFEGANVDRHLDLMLHNEQCNPANTPPMVYQDAAASGEKSCADFLADEESKCNGAPQRYNAKGDPAGLDCSQHPGCREAKACVLKPKKEDKTFCCDPAKTGHHLIEVHSFCQRGARGTPLPIIPGLQDERRSLRLRRKALGSKRSTGHCTRFRV